MKPRSFLPLVSALTLAACSSSADYHSRLNQVWTGGSTKPMRIDDLQALNAGKPIRANVIQVSFGGWEKGSKDTTMNVRPGQRSLVEVIREFRYPTAFELPQTDARVVGVTPTTPTQFETQNTGVTIEFTPTLRGPWVVLSGSVQERVFEGFTQNPGEALRPISNRAGQILTPNRVTTPMFTTRETPFFAALRPGQKDAMYVNTKDGPRRMTVVCELVK